MVLVYVPTSKVGGSSFSTALQALVIRPHFFLLAILVGVKYLPKNVIAEIALGSQIKDTEDLTGFLRARFLN